MNRLQLANIKLIKNGLGKDERKNQLRIFAELYK